MNIIKTELVVKIFINFNFSLTFYYNNCSIFVEENNEAMSNYKALGIEKEMISEFENHNKSELQILMDSCYFQHPSIERRKQGEEYCTVEVVGCSGKGWWYENLFGMQFFCRIRYRNYAGIKQVSEYLGVKLTNTKEIQFRTFDPRDVIII